MEKAVLKKKCGDDEILMAFRRHGSATAAARALRGCALDLSPAEQQQSRYLSRDHVLALHEHGLTSREIAERLGGAESSVNGMLQRLGIPPRNVHLPPLNDEEAAEVRRLHALGWSKRKIAQALGRGHSANNTALSARRYRVRRNRRWIGAEERATMAAMARTDYTIVRIMTETGRSEGTVSRALHRAGLPKRSEAVDRGRVMRLLALRIPAIKVARDVDCSQTTAFRYARRMRAAANAG
ncbi:hypothetical protein [Azospirillum soli]|uniref:hypothetical protein n=1 Tax=Azospirillum soli TaxID=1304799 RepID=UPI001AE86E1E|nr:hypothetical protein [Azospirillum soli]MBP2315447.1 transposase [Azospirillum soli]